MAKVAIHEHYELWDTETANLIGFFDSLKEACEETLATIQANDGWAGLALHRWRCKRFHKTEKPKLTSAERSRLARKAAYAMHAKHGNDTFKQARANRLAKYGPEGIAEQNRRAWERSVEVRRARKELSR